MDNDGNVVDYKDDRSAPWNVNDVLYVLSLGRTEGDFIFIAWKGKTDTWVPRSAPMEILFNGKEIAPVNEKEALTPFVRQR